MKDLPLFQLILSENEEDENGVSFVTLVDRPAIKRNFLAFSERQMFEVQDEDQRIISGPAMVPDTPIYRKDENGEYNVVFDAATIRKVATRFFKKGYQANINTVHGSKEAVAESVFFESWIVDREKGKLPLSGFEDLPDGTWFLSAKINDDDTWGKVKSGDYKGFSVEGFFDWQQKTPNDPEQAFLSHVKNILDQVTE